MTGKKKKSADEMIDAMLEEYGTSSEAVLVEAGIRGTLKQRLERAAGGGEGTEKCYRVESAGIAMQRLAGV